MPTSNRQILLASRPKGEPTPENFKWVESDIPSPGPGQMLLRTIYLSLDPYMRGRMNAGKSYARPVKVGEVTKRITFRGFIVSDFASQFPQFLADMVPWLKEGKVKYKEDITDGLENAPRELIGLLKGENFGKKIIRVGKEPDTSQS